MVPDLPASQPTPLLAGPRLVLVLGLLLAGLTVLVYGRTLGHGFVFDDESYISANPWVLRGLTWDSVRWALAFNERMYWHPLTWLSLMGNVQVLGTEPWGFHLVNLVLHGTSSLLLFWFFLSSTGRVWPAFLVAALFCVHPMHVESVAWAAERKDVLAALFWMLTMLAYLGYVQRPGPIRYLGVCLGLGLGLMAKPLLVTLPFALLLLDYWPLGRFGVAGADDSRAASRAGGGQVLASWPGLVREKLPLLALALASVAVSFLSHQAEASGPAPVEWGLRAANALRSVFIYLEKLVWPAGLAVHHPFPDRIPGWQTAAGVAGLALATGAALGLGRTRPSVPVGWLWFLGTLVPGLKLYRLGLWYEYADRFAYIPYVGLYAVAAYALADLAGRRPEWARLLGAAGGAAVLVLAHGAWTQAGHWRDDAALFTRAVDMHGDNWLAHNNLGSALLRQGRDPALAERHFREALRLHPGFELARRNLGVALSRAGRLPEAEAQFQEALRLKPDYLDAHTDLGVALLRLGRPAEAEAHLRQALALEPDLPGAVNNLGLALMQQDRLEEAVPVLARAVALAPGLADARNNLGVALARLGRHAAAAEQFEQALALSPGSVQARRNLEEARTLARTPRP